MYIIEWRRETFERTISGKSWKRNPVEVEVEYITEKWHEIKTSEEELRFWRAFGGCRAERNYTPCGYLVTNMTRTRPDGEVKVRESFKHIEMREADRAAGFRERSIARRAERLSITAENGRVLYRFSTDEEFCIWDATSKKWVN